MPKTSNNNWQEVDLYRNSPYSVDSALNMELLERGWSLLDLWKLPERGGLNLADYILAIGLQQTLLDTIHAERYSPFYSQVVLRWEASCAQFVDVVDRNTVEAITDLLIWVSMKMAGSLTAAYLGVQSQSEDDMLFRLMVKMMVRYPEMRDWIQLERVLKKFQWREDCMRFWYLVWEDGVGK